MNKQGGQLQNCLRKEENISLENPKSIIPDINFPLKHQQQQLFQKAWVPQELIGKIPNPLTNV